MTPIGGILGTITEWYTRLRALLQTAAPPAQARWIPHERWFWIAACLFLSNITLCPYFMAFHAAARLPVVSFRFSFYAFTTTNQMSAKSNLPSSGSPCCSRFTASSRQSTHEIWFTDLCKPSITLLTTFPISSQQAYDG